MYSAVNNGKIEDRKKKNGSHRDYTLAVFDRLLSGQISILHIAPVTDIDFVSHEIALRVEFFLPW